MDLTIYTLDQSGRAWIANLARDRGHRVTDLHAEDNPAEAVQRDRPDILLVGSADEDRKTLKTIKPHARTAVVALDSLPDTGDNLCLDRIPDEFRAQIVINALRRLERFARVRRQTASVAARAVRLRNSNRQLRSVNRRLQLVTESSRRMFGTGEEARVANEVLQTISRYTGGAPAVLYVARKDGLVARMGLGVKAEKLEHKLIPVEPAAWKGARPFDTFLAERELESRLSDTFGSDNFYYLPLANHGRPHAMVVVGGKPEDADRSALKQFLPIASLAVQTARRMRSLKILAQHDSLTGLLNQASFHRSLRLEVKRHSRAENKFTVVMLDIDHFKLINDKHGHPAGDRTLKLVAERLRKGVRETDVVARYGGEEFVLILTNTDRDGAEQKVGDMLSEIRELRLGNVGPVTLSAGLATYPDDGVRPEELVDAADRALYAAKSGGRDRAMTYAEWLERTFDEDDPLGRTGTD